jgi:hypothetical protein
MTMRANCGGNSLDLCEVGIEWVVACAQLHDDACSLSLEQCHHLVGCCGREILVDLVHSGFLGQGEPNFRPFVDELLFVCHFEG